MKIDKELVDAVTTRMVLKPSTLDVIVATNLHADILSDLAAALSGSLGITENQLRQHLRILVSTIARRASVGRLSTAESDHICALVTVLNAAIELFEGDLCAARQWMKSPERGLYSRAPLDMMATRVVTQAVIELIGRLELGVE